MFEIYKITNCVNGKIYIGLTGFGFRKRWSCHKSYAYRGSMSLLHCAIRKYGTQQFVICSIDHAETREEARQKEKQWIHDLKSNDRSIGYNVKEGGEVYTLTEETKEKISASHKKRFEENPRERERYKVFRPKGEWKPPQEWVDKMIETKQKQKEAGILVLSEETKNKIRQTLQDKKEQARKTTNKQFDSKESRKKHSEVMKTYYASHPEKKGRPPVHTERDEFGRYLPTKKSKG